MGSGFLSLYGRLGRGKKKIGRSFPLGSYYGGRGFGGGACGRELLGAPGQPKKKDPNISKIDPGDSENAIGTRKATKIRRIGSKVTTRLSGRHPVLWSPPGSQVATRFSGYHPALRSPPGSLVTTRFLGYHPALRLPPGS